MRQLKPLSNEQKDFLDLVDNWFNKEENQLQFSDELQTLFKRRVKLAYNLFGGADPIFNHINDFNRAISFIINLEIEKDIRSKEIKIELQDKEHKIIELINQLEKWVNSAEVKTTYDYSKHQSIINKLEECKTDPRILSPLNNFIGNFEEAKKFISEIFYPKQERFYNELESWAKSEIEDKECSEWISDYLREGRRMRIYKIKIFKFIKDKDKAKEFLLSKYEEKLNWDRIKIEKYRVKQEIIDRKLAKKYKNFEKRIKKDIEKELYLNQNSEVENNCYDQQNRNTPLINYRGSWAQNVEGYSDDDIDTIFDGDPNAYWNID